MIFIFPTFAKHNHSRRSVFCSAVFFSPTEGGDFFCLFCTVTGFFSICGFPHMPLSATYEIRRRTVFFDLRILSFASRGIYQTLKTGADEKKPPSEESGCGIDFFTLRNNDHLCVAKYFSRLTVSFQIYLLYRAGNFAVFGGHCHNRLRLVGRKGLS